MRAFLAVQTQWSVGMGGPTGLDYARARAGLRLAGIKASPEIFAQLRIMESAALSAMNSKKGTASQ